MSQLLVMGGAGFIGSHLVDKLVALGHEVTSLDNLMLGKKEFVNKQAKFIQADIRDKAALQEAMRGAEAVFHLAADPRLPISIEDPLATHEINVTGTLNVLEAARQNKVGKVIFTSSCAIYGDQGVPIREDATPKPLSPYGLHKLMGEEYCRLYSSLFGLETVCLRYFNVFGPRKLATGAYPMVIPIFLQQKKAGQPLTIVGNGTATRDYVHVRDVVDANLKAWQSAVQDGTAINIGSGVETSVQAIADIIGGAVTHLPPRLGEMQNIAADNTRARELLGWTPTVSFAEGIEELKKL